MADTPRAPRKSKTRRPARTRRVSVVRGRRLGRVVRLAGGWVILGVGVAFVLLPIIPGLPVVVLGAFLLAPDVPLFARLLDWSKARFSRAAAIAASHQERFAEDFRRRFSP